MFGVLGIYNFDYSKEFWQFSAGSPSGFDIMYLALGDRNMQVRYDLKVVWES